LVFLLNVIERTRGLAHRAELDGNPDLLGFCLKLEAAVISTVEGGVMTKDLALNIHGAKMKRSDYVLTREFIEFVEKRLKKELD
jgi:isocitrate dehydrogenase